MNTKKIITPTQRVELYENCWGDLEQDIQHILDKIIKSYGCFNIKNSAIEITPISLNREMVQLLADVTPSLGQWKLDIVGQPHTYLLPDHLNELQNILTDATTECIVYVETTLSDQELYLLVYSITRAWCLYRPQLVCKINGKRQDHSFFLWGDNVIYLDLWPEGLCLLSLTSTQHVLIVKGCIIQDSEDFFNQLWKDHPSLYTYLNRHNNMSVIVVINNEIGPIRFQKNLCELTLLDNLNTTDLTNKICFVCLNETLKAYIQTIFMSQKILGIDPTDYTESTTTRIKKKAQSYPRILIFYEQNMTELLFVKKIFEDLPDDVLSQICIHRLPSYCKIHRCEEIEACGCPTQYDAPFFSIEPEQLNEQIIRIRSSICIQHETRITDEIVSENPTPPTSTTCCDFVSFYQDLKKLQVRQRQETVPSILDGQNEISRHIIEQLLKTRDGFPLHSFSKRHISEAMRMATKRQGHKNLRLIDVAGYFGDRLNEEYYVSGESVLKPSAALLAIYQGQNSLVSQTYGNIPALPTLIINGYYSPDDPDHFVPPHPSQTVIDYLLKKLIMPKQHIDLPQPGLSGFDGTIEIVKTDTEEICKITGNMIDHRVCSIPYMISFQQFIDWLTNNDIDFTKQTINRNPTIIIENTDDVPKVQTAIACQKVIHIQHDHHKTGVKGLHTMTEIFETYFQATLAKYKQRTKLLREDAIKKLRSYSTLSDETFNLWINTLFESPTNRVNKYLPETVDYYQHEIRILSSDSAHRILWIRDLLNIKRITRMD